MNIHPTAIVDSNATLGDVAIGPYAVVGPDVELADGVRVGPHCVIEGPTTVGSSSVLHAHVALGGPPQDQKHDPNVRTTLIIGSNNIFREFSTVHRGTSGGGRTTVVGDHNVFMANSHVAHDCQVGSHVTFANSAAIGGHVVVEDGAVLGGLCAIHQFSRVGRLSMIGGGAMCAQDVPPFTIAQGDRAKLYGLNIIGLRRAGFDDQTVSALKDAWRMLFLEGLPKRVALSRAEAAHGTIAEVATLLAFLRESERGVCRAHLAGR